MRSRSWFEFLNLLGIFNCVNCQGTQSYWFQLHNLRPFSHENTLREAEKNNIWIPSITFANTATMVSVRNIHFFGLKYGHLPCTIIITQERSLRDNASLVTVARDKHISYLGIKITNYVVFSTWRPYNVFFVKDIEDFAQEGRHGEE